MCMCVFVCLLCKHAVLLKAMPIHFIDGKHHNYEEIEG